MFLGLLRSGRSRLAAAFVGGLFFLGTLGAQVSLVSGTNTQSFDTLSGGLPAGWTVSTGATATSLGTSVTPVASAVSWANTTGQWQNSASATGLTGTEAAAVQAAATNRALAVRQSGSFGDPGAAATFHFSTSGLLVTGISFKAQQLNAQGRSTTWSLQYGLGAAPASWTTIATFADPGVFGSTTVTASGYGTALNNQAEVRLRVVALSATTGSGSRDVFALDDFTITTAPDAGPTPPSITTPPAAQTVTEGATVQFTVAAAGEAPLAYQWRKGASPLSDGGNLAGANAATLTLSGVAVADAGTYDVVVSNAAGSVTSAAALLTVNPLLVAPSITTQPSPQSAALGGTASFTVAASGTAPLVYQWRKGGSALSDGGNIAGAATATLTVTGVGAGDVGSYDVVVTNLAGTATSGSAALTLAATVTPSGEIAYTGGAYAQNFDTLPSAGTFTLGSAGPVGLDEAPINATGLGGWSLAKYAGSGSVALFRVDAGTSTSGSVYSYGTSGAGDRALGALSSGSTVPRFGVMLINSTGRTITEFSLSYTGEQWRRGSASANKLTFEYALDGADLNSGTFVAVPALDFTAPNTGGAGALDGNAAANRTAVAGTVGGLAWAPGQLLVLRWSDVDDSGSDDGLAIDDLSFSTPVAANAILPAVIYTTPANGTVNIATDTTITVAFNEAVNFAETSFTLTGSVSGVHAATVSGGPASYTLTPAEPFAEGETVTLMIAAAGVTDAATGTEHPGADYTTSFITFSTAPLPIHTIQGSGLRSPYANYPVTIAGVVVASYQASGLVGGYYLQTPDGQQDADPATSEGIYIYDNANSVTVGDYVTLTGTVKEYQSSSAASLMTQTELTDVTVFTKVSAGNPLPAPVAVALPFASAYAAERYEGMRVTFPQTLTVTDNYDLGHFGEVVLSHGRLMQPTNVAAPGAAANAVAAANALNQILFDDGSAVSYPSPTPYLTSADPALATRRTGSTVTGATGVLDTRFGLYTVEPTEAPTFVDANPRTAPPVSLGSLRVVFGNVENFMNGDGAGGGFPTSRGASTQADYQRQLAKVTAAILALAPDIMGISEMENDRITNGLPNSYGPTSAVAELVANLNAQAPAGTSYAFVDASAVDSVTDVIHSVILYRVETVEPVGAPAMLDNEYFNNHARNPLAQTFREKASGAKFTFCVNHFRAKASVSSKDDGTGLNNDQNDGQGSNNYLRTKEAQALTAWLAGDPTGSGDPRVLIVGDLNAYAKEDPITAIVNAGYINLAERFEGEGGYSYAFNGTFGHLDHALASPSLNAEVLSTATWHANADEPVYYAYGTEDKDAAQQAINAGTPYRFADHDPVVIGLALRTPPQITADLTAQTTTVGEGVTFSVTVTGTPAPSFQWRRNGVDIPGATSASYTIAHPTTADAGSYDVVITNSAGSITSAAAVLTVNPAAATVVLPELAVAYDGQPQVVVPVTTPAGLPVTVTYDGAATPPVYPGVYAVVATIDSPDYTGSAEGELVVSTAVLVQRAPTLNASVIGSVQVLSAASVTLNGSAVVAGDLLLPGTPAVRLNGQPAYGGTVDGPGAAAPSGHTVTLNGKAALRHVVRRIDARAMPVVAAPPAPAGTRNVSLNAAGNPVADFATLRNLTLNGNVGAIAVPPGTYGSFTANGSNSLVFGVAGSTEPAVYNLQGLTLNGTSRLTVVGPVILNLASGTAVNGNLGASGRPEWLELNLANGGLTLNGNITVEAIVTAPKGTVTLNGGSVLHGRVTADGLTLNGTAVLVEPQD